MTNSKPYFGRLLKPRFPASGQRRALMKTTVKTKLRQNFQKKEPLQVLFPTRSMEQIAHTSPPKSVTANRVDSRPPSFSHSPSICPSKTDQRLTHLHTPSRSVCYQAPMDRKWRKFRALDRSLLSSAKARDHRSDRFPKADSA